jgi:hypothetical protein
MMQQCDCTRRPLHPREREVLGDWPPSVLPYRILTCWLRVFVGWPITRWLTRNE